MCVLNTLEYPHCFFVVKDAAAKYKNEVEKRVLVWSFSLATWLAWILDKFDSG